MLRGVAWRGIGRVWRRLDAVNDAGESALHLAAKSSNRIVISLLCDVFHFRHRDDSAFHHDGGRHRNTHLLLNMPDEHGRE